jgi:uncharacterized membrane protein YbhN (UPF0104 family)
MNKLLKTILAPLIVLVTLVVFAWYIHGHPQIIDQLKNLPVATIGLILLLYTGAFLAYVLITRGSLRLYEKTMSGQENILFNAYSSLVNFFGPGQSGPIFRGTYLKKRHNLGVKQYLFTTLLYYGFLAVISVLCMFGGSRPWWQTAIVMIAAAVCSAWVIGWYKRRSRIGTISGLSLTNIAWIFGATIVQVALLAIIYGVELHQVGANVSISQVLAYTGVANLALFVAITPGAIGIREGFLVFSQDLHHISSTNIVAASVVDRAVYLVFLGLLFILVIALHAKDKLHVTEKLVEEK